MTIAMRGGPSSGTESPQDNAVQVQNISSVVTQGNQVQTSPLDDSGAHGEVNSENELPEGQEPDFPHAELARLDEMINRPRWVVPVLSKGELEVLLDAAIDLCKRGLDVRSEACQRFFRDGLTLSFTKILTDEAVSGWKFEIHRCIMKNCERLVELCVSKLSQDWFPLLDLLAMVLNPNNKFHTYNGTRPSETVPLGSQIPEEELFARPSDARTPRGWLVDLINKFGQLGGFQILSDRFQNGPSLTVPVIAALIRPFGLCYEFLTVHTIEKAFMPIVDVVPTFLDNLTDEELNKEAKNEAKNDALSAIIKALKCLVSRVPNHDETVKNLEVFRLKMILRLLQISPFNGKMNALNEVNKLIASVSYYSHRHSSIEEEEWLTAERMAEWIRENKVLQIVLRDNLHQPQYVEKLEKIIRFIIKEKALTLEDLDSIWAAQSGKHEAIVKNVHDLLAKLAWDFSPEQLDHLFDCFQSSWTNASRKQREKLLELIRRLAEDDKDGVMAHKVLSLLWSLAHSDDVPTEIMDQALTAHVKILDYSCSQDRDSQKTQWLDKCVEELKNDKWVLPALKQIREICCLYQEAPSNFNHTQRAPHTFYRHEVINRLQQQHSLVILVAENLTAYMNKARSTAKENPDLDPQAIWPDSRYSHVQQVQERLYFLRFLLKDGQLWLCAPQAKQIWQCLAENAVFITDREACFKWFSKLMGDEPDLDPEINKNFFENNILQLDPSLLTENGMKCFDRFFRAVNSKEGKLLAKRRAYLMDDEELVGLDYIWRVVLCSGEEIANKAIQLLKETYTNLGPRLQNRQLLIHEDFIQSCTDRLKAAYDTISILERDKDSVNRMRQETTRMVRVLKVLYEYICECDNAYGEERTFLPMARAYRGKHVTLLVRFPNQGRQVEDLDIWTHTNDTLSSIRRKILNRVVKVNNTNMKVELFINGEALDSADDKKLISQIPLRDKTLITAKLCQVGSNMPSSPDSSSDSSTGSPQHAFEGPNAEQEKYLPGVLMAQHNLYVQFLFQLSDLGSSLQISQLRDGARAVLRIMPADGDTMKKLKALCRENSSPVETLTPSLESMYFASSPSQVLYNLEVTYALLMPALDPTSDEAFEVQRNFMQSGGVQVVLGMLTKNNFLTNADVSTKRAAYLVVLKMCKLMLTAVAQAIVQTVVHNVNCQSETTTKVPQSTHNHAVILQQALHHIPNPNSDCMLRTVTNRLAQHLLEQATGHLPDMATVKSVIRLAWSSSSGSMHFVHASYDELHKMHEMLSQKPVNSDEPQNQGLQPENDDIQVCKEALETLTLALALYPQGLEILIKEKSWQNFIIDLTLLCKNRSVRVSAAEQFLLIATKCSTTHHPLLFFITLLFTVLSTTVRENAKNSHEYFLLLCRLLNYACISNCQLQAVEHLLTTEITWLKKIKENVKQTGDIQVEEALLEGHLGVTRELICFLRPEVKFEIGSDEKKNICLIKELIEDFVFPASKLMLQFQKTGEMPSEPAIPVCNSVQTVIAAFDVLVALATGCVQNMRQLAEMLMDIYNPDKEVPLCDWEYLPPVGPRPCKGFVGLKNAGATCYMNSVLQQLYMIDSIRNGILGVEGAADDPNEDFSGEEKLENENNMESNEGEGFGEDKQASKEESRKEYNIGVLKQIQAIFGHLICSKLQYYVPRGLWKHFKLGGEPVNLREQHDALEFFNSLVDSVDEALKALGHEQLLSKVLGGSFADQKICKGCPHRYSREESFTTLNIDIRNHSNLLDSLEQYVKGDLLEGANAYHCEKCSKKVDTVKRMCIKKLPPILAIQLKRFDYDWERECAVKFNDYFEFPRDLDMGPYTVSGLAKIEGEAVQNDSDLEDDLEESPCTKYKLTGIVVHSGQASGGHYYSYILHRHCDEMYKWFKFDDGEVTECKMDDDEEMKNQCFGGEYMGEVFDHMLKRMSYRRQKRWWNAYILVYTRTDVEEDYMAKSFQEMSLYAKHPSIKMPMAIERSVCQQNIRFMHNRNQFSIEYFQFMKKLINCNAPYVAIPPGQEKLSADGEELAMISIQLASKFLFNTGFHTKKTLRGPANEWYEALCIHLRCSRNVRLWFAQNVLFNHPRRFSEYLLECPSSEVRTSFVRIIVFLAHFSLQDGPCPSSVVPGISQISDTNATLSDHLLHTVLLLLKKEVSENGRHLTQYFSLFLMYASLGITERTQLLKINVPATFMLVALDEGPGPPIRYQYAELGKLYQVVSQLIRCCDVSSRMQSSVQGKPPLPNVHNDPDCTEYIMPIQPQVAEILYSRPSYIKKIIEDANMAEDTYKLLAFCSWENPQFSSMVLSELLWQIAYSYTYELRPYLDLLLRMLMLDDSWQNHRIHNALKGIPDDRDGLFDTIHRSKNHYQKRAYQCIKCMVALFGTCPAAAHMLHSNGDMKRKWTWAVEWLNGELERRPYSTNAPYAYNNWSPPAQSNETSNGYFLERSHSARMTLAKAIVLCPEEEQDEQDVSEEVESLQLGDSEPITFARGSLPQQQQQQQQAAPSSQPPQQQQQQSPTTQQYPQQFSAQTSSQSQSSQSDQSRPPVQHCVQQNPQTPLQHQLSERMANMSYYVHHSRAPCMQRTEPLNSSSQPPNNLLQQNSNVGGMPTDPIFTKETEKHESEA